MESLTFAAKLLILICLLRIPGVMADPTIIPNSDQIYDFETEDKLSIKNVTPIANSNKSSSNSSARLTSSNNEFIYYYEHCHNEGACSFECDSGNADTLFTELTPIYNQHQGCSACGISVILTAGVQFPESLVRSSWRIGNIQLSRFEVNLIGVTKVETNAFSDQAFRSLETLVLTCLQITVFNNGTFNGLTSLRTLRLYALKTYDFTPGFLTGISATLNYLVLNGPGNLRTPNQIDGLTGGIELPLVKMFQITTDLNGTLSFRTFSALKGIRVLILSDCKIEEIPPGTFNPIQSTLQKLYLDRNRLKTIHQDFWNIIIYIQRDLFIYLYGNPWHCDSDIETYKNVLNFFYWRFPGAEPTCASPAHLRDKLVKNADLWADPPETTQTTIISTTVTPPTTVAGGIEGVIYSECPSSSFPSDIVSVPITSQTLTLGLSQNENGELMVTQTSHISSALTLIWFQSDSQTVFQQNASTLNCLRLISFKTVIKNLVLNTAYTFCLMDQNALVISPLNCGSYYHRIQKKDNSWLAIDNLACVIGSTVFALLLSVIFGTVLGVLILRQNPNWIKSNFQTSDAFDINHQQSKSDIYENKHISSEADQRLSALRLSVAAKLPEFITSDFYPSDVHNYEMTLHKLTISKYKDHSEIFNYPECLPIADVAPPLPARLEMETFFGEPTNYYHNTHFQENHYSTLEDVYYGKPV